MKSTVVPFYFFGYLMGDNFYKEDNSLFTSISHGKLREARKKQKERYDQAWEIRLPNCLPNALNATIKAVTVHFDKILTPLTCLDLRQYISGQVLSNLLSFREKHYYKIMNDLYLSKTRLNAGKNFEQWILKKVKSLRAELQLEREKHQALILLSDYSIEKEEENKDKSENHTFAKELREMKLFRSSHSIATIENRIRSLKPIHKIWQASSNDNKFKKANHLKKS